MTFYDSQYAPLEPPKQALEGQGFARRAVAYLIDTVIYYVAIFITSFVTGTVFGILSVSLGFQINGLSGSAIPAWLDIGISMLMFVLYFAVFEWLYGATPAKAMLGMRVVAENGDPCSLSEALIRGVLRIVDAFFFAIPAYASMSTSDLRQRLGDKAAHTVVANKDNPSIYNTRTGVDFLKASAVALLLLVVFSVLIIYLTI